MSSGSHDPRIGFFDALADGWDEEEPSAEEMVARLDQQAELLALQPGDSLLEVGCGTGKTTACLVRAVTPGRVTAVDFAPEMIAQAVAKHIDADFACMDVCSDDLGEAKYDVILCFHSFPHFRDQSAALKNFARAIKPGGRLIVMHLAGSDYINHFHASVEGAVQHDVLPVGEEWPPLLAQAHLQQTKCIDRQDLFFLEAIAGRK